MTAMSKGKSRGAVVGALARIPRRREERYEKALGKLTIRFSFLHFLLEKFSWEVWNLNGDVAQIVTKDLRTMHLVEKLKASTKHVISREADRRTLLSILKRVEKATKERNELLHSLWFILKGEPVIFISKRRGRLEGSEAPSADQINTLCQTLLQITCEFDEFMEQRRPRGPFGFGSPLVPQKGE